jgi:protein-S-isoprenylcysteine O-methyltransferase Ste14
MQSLELKVPPVPLALVAAAAMWLVARLVPTLTLLLPWRGAIAALLLACGAGLALAGVLEFRRARTTVNPLRPATASTLVTSGVYRISRNPMYAGLLVALGGWTYWLGNAAALAFLPAFVVYMNKLQIAPEERALRDRFGPVFDAYAASVRRWL